MRLFQPLLRSLFFEDSASAMSADFSQFQPGNPFLSDLAPAESLPERETVPLHPAALEDLEQTLHWARLESPEAAGRGHGQTVLLRAPRAGFGKSHLLARLRGRAEAGESWVARVYFDPENGAGWRMALAQVLEDWHRPAAGGMGSPPGMEAGSPTVLDLLGRRIFSVMTASLIREGRVPCADAERTAADVERDFTEMFDFADPAGQPMAGWFQENFEMLLAAALPRLRALTGLPDAGLRSWIRALCGYAQGGAERDPRRLDTLHWALRQPVAEEPERGGSGAEWGAMAGSQWLTAVTEDEGFFRRMLTGLCRLAAVCRPLVVMLDHLDGFYTNSSGLLKLGRLLSDWRQLSGRTVLVLSVNEDLWANGFQKALPSALEDRINNWEISLGGISLLEAEALVRSRLVESRVPPAVAAGFWASLNLAGLARTGEFGNQPLSPRAVLRHAARQWREYWRPAGSGQMPVSPSATMPGAMPMPGNITPPNPQTGYGPPALTPLPRPAWTAPAGTSFPPFPASQGPAPQAPPPMAWPQQNAWPQPAAWAPPAPAPSLSRPPQPQSAWPQSMPPPPAWPIPPEPAWSSVPPPSMTPQAGWSPHPFHGQHAVHENPAAGSPALPPLTSAFQQHPAAPWPLPPASPPKPESRQTTIAPRFRELRDYFLSAHPPQPDQDRLSRLVKTSGQGLQAVVRYEEFPLPGSGRKVAVWQSPDGEILFGTEPHDDRAYWTTLLAFARQRVHLGIGVRLVVFSAAAAPVNLAAWLPQDEIVAARARFLDVLTLDPTETATLHAAEQILREAACGALPLSPVEAFSAMEPHLDFWWKRLMRPLTTFTGGAGGW